MSENNKKQEKTKMDRRSFLTSTLGAATFLQMSPLELLANSMIEGILGKAHAQEAGASDLMYYVHLLGVGGLPRYYFDLPLDPNGQGGVEQTNSMLITDSTEKYRTHLYKGIHFPHIWSGQIPTRNGGQTSMTNLLDHSLMIRGINLQSNGHAPNQDKQSAPVVGQPSITGLVSDAHQSLLPALRSGGAYGFKARSGVSQVAANGGQPLESMLDSFQYEGGFALGEGREQVESLISRAVDSLRLHGENKDKKVKSLFKDRQNAIKLFRREFGNLRDVYHQLHQKYETLIRRSMKEFHVKKVDDRELRAGEGLKYRADNSFRNVTPGTDLRDLLVQDGQTLGSAGISVSNNDTTISGLAKVMAVSEFTLVNNLSTSLTMSFSHLRNTYLPYTEEGVDKVARNVTISNDAHRTGAVCAMFYFTKYYQALGACLNELVTSLKAAHIFDKTVINLASEFNRSPKSNDSGADHGWQGSNSTLISGMIDSPLVTGNILKNWGHNRWPGGWGVAAPHNFVSGREFLIGNVASTISTMLECESATPNDASLVKKTGGKVSLLSGRPKNV